MIPGSTVKVLSKGKNLYNNVSRIFSVIKSFTSFQVLSLLNFGLSACVLDRNTSLPSSADFFFFLLLEELEELDGITSGDCDLSPYSKAAFFADSTVAL